MGGVFTTDTKSKVLSSVFEFNTQSQVLRRRSSMNERRAYFKTFLSQHLTHAFIIGGTTEKRGKQKPIGSVEKLDTRDEKSKWEIVAPL